MRSRLVDRELAQAKRRDSGAVPSRPHRIRAVGFIQPSDQVIDGRRLFALIANNGSTVAYLDIPPGLDAAQLMADRVGVTGTPHFNEHLGTRLITVCDVESIDAKR